jgi:hypothetical protein
MSKLSRIFVTVRMLAMTLAASFLLSSVVVPAAEEVVELGDGSSPQPTDAASPVSSPWPVQVTDNGRTFLIYQPQVDKWENTWLEGRSAVSVRNDASGQQNFGVVYFSARTELDQASRTVTVRDAVISKADFPAVAAGVDDYLSILRPQFAAHSWRVAQDRLQSDMEIDRLAQQSSKQPLKNDPPRILYSERPAVLVPIDGNPVLRAVADTGLMRITNTRALILRDKATSRYFLFVSDHWMEAPSLDGPWRVTVNPSAQMERAKQLVTGQDQVDLLEADAEEGAVTPASVAVFIGTTPTELLQTDGPAQYAPIERTQLLYVTNSPNKLFLDLRTQNHYALISGRWYRTTTLAQGQWSYVSAASLPSDFAMIPAEHPTESVRAAVPGTPQAREAVIANSVPQVATVARSSAHLEITYDGNPVFQPIEGTALQSAVNSPVPVIRISEESFYALDNGVWFVASSPFGPWAVTSYVPSVIYSIPRSSPLYYVTYVRVYDATPQVVYVGYTPGYVGSYVSSDNVVVYGTGWPYSPWIGSVWYGAPVTWGFGFSFVYSWWYPYPWYSWHRVAWAPPPPCFRPWWGPWHAPVYGHAGFVAGSANATRPPGSRLHNVGRIYDRWDNRSVVWNGPRAIAHQQRPAAPTHSARGHDFVAGPDGRWDRLGDDGNRSRGRRDAQVRGNVVNSPTVQTPRVVQTPAAAQTPSAVQTPWRRPPAANQEHQGSGQPRVQPPSLTANERRPADNRQLPPRERVWDQRQANEALPRARVDGPPIIDRSRVNGQQDRPAPQVQSPQRIPPVAGVPMERAPSQPQHALPQLRSFSPPQGRIERPAINTGGIERPAINTGRIGQPAMTNPGHIERPVVANPGRAMERPSVNPGRMVERSADQAQFRGNEGRGQSNSGGGGGGEFRGGWGHR